MNNTLQTLVAHPLRGYAPQVAMSLWQLEDARERTLRWLHGIDSELLDWSPPGETVNTIGTLLYHIGAIEMDWIFGDVLNIQWPDGLQNWFPVSVRDVEGRLTVFSGEPIDRHIERLATVRQLVLEYLRPMTDEDFSKPRVTDTYIVTPVWAVHHLCQHEAEHRAEMAVLASRAMRD